MPAPTPTPSLSAGGAALHLWPPPPRRRSANSRPSFLWLLRDHHLQMRSEPREEMLEKMDVSAQRTLRRCFADYDCMPLPRPLDEDDKLRSLDTLTFGDLKDSFREEFAILERSLRRRLARPRVLGARLPSHCASPPLYPSHCTGGTEVTGDIVASLIRRYTSSIANRSVRAPSLPLPPQGKRSRSARSAPTPRPQGLIKEIAHMPTQRQMLVQMAGERAIRAGVEAYRAHVKSSGVQGRFPIPTHDLQCVCAPVTAAQGQGARPALTGLRAQGGARGGGGSGAGGVRGWRHRGRGGDGAIPCWP